ncbi:MAG: alpha-L-fucosidase [Bacteroidales bacterium]|jgi:alpha-L-fucosidase|nr:alpha-L-fucosidase [Bacteroidales bacterium]
MNPKATFISIILCIAGLNVTFAQNNYDFYKQKYPSWFSDAKLGIFIHYGVYSVPSWSGAEQYAEWFYKGLIGGDTARENFQRRVYGDDFRYEDYKGLFRSELFNADEWAALFAESGAKYVIFTSKHHDGFCMWDDSLSGTWNSVHSPCKIDFCRQLSQACRKKNLKFGLYYSLLEWNNPLFRWTVDSAGLERYVKDYMQPQFKSLVQKFKPDLLFADGDWDFSPRQLGSEDLVQYYYDMVGAEGIVNNRWGVGFDYGYLTPEYSSGISELKRPWAECRGLSRSFGLNRNADLSSYMTGEELILHFVSLVAAGGGLTLNVAPSADGQIPLLQQERLLDLGKWLKTNGEAIYGAKPCKDAAAYYTAEEAYENDTVINYDWVRNAPKKGMPEDNFGVKWYGYIIPKYSEEYTIYLKADDMAYLNINELYYEGMAGDTTLKMILCDSAFTHKPLKTTIRLKKDIPYLFNLLYEEKDLNASVSLQWESRHRPKESVKGNWHKTYWWIKPTSYLTQKGNDLYVMADLNYSDDQTAVSLPKAPKENMQITCLDTENMYFLWQYKDGKLMIDTSNLKFGKIKSKGVVVFKLEGYLQD